MIGDDFLICPKLKNNIPEWEMYIDERINSWEVNCTIPKGQYWYDYFSKEPITGDSIPKI